MSRKGGIFREKHSPQKGNVLKITTKHGENLSQQQNILISPPKRGGNHRAKKNVLKTATKPGETAAAERKCPENRHKTWRNRRHRGKMSRKPPQNREEPSPQRENVPKPPQNRGKDVRFRRLSGTFVNVKTD